MSDFFISIAAVAVVLGFMILIHEFGHFAVAKLLGVRVEQFAIGFGKRIVGFKKGDTDYRINVLPLGGYVKMSGENPMDDRTGDPAEFMSHPRWHRFLIAIAGPTMNILLAIFLLTAVYMVHYEYPAFADKPAVIEGLKHDSPAARAGLQVGDRIVEVDGIKNPTWEQLQPRVLISPNQPLNVTIQRGDQIFQKTIVPQAVTTSEVGSAGWFPEDPIVVGEVEANTPAARAGLKEDDKIIAMNGKPLIALEAMIDDLQQIKQNPVDLTVIRGNQTLNFHNLIPVLGKTEDPKEQRYRLGFVARSENKVTTLPFTQALSRSLDQNKKYSLLILELAKKLVQGKVSPRMVSGPIGIAQDAGYAAQQKGWTPLMELTAGISLNLGIFNLLPIPILDGGVILFLFIEAVMRRDVNLRIKERVYQAAFVFLVLFAVMVIYNDLMKTLPGLMDRLP
jgi:regulator of sigma E protease